MQTFKNRISGIYTLLSPLSHIGESTGVDSFLNTQSVITQKGAEEVFLYSGNALRGVLRDSAATYMLNMKGEDTKESIDMLYLLYSGGSLAGEHKTDIKKMLKLKEKLPFLSLFGGGIGNNLLSGSMNVSDGYLLCRELIDSLPNEYANDCLHSWRSQTCVRSYSRMDDLKDWNKAMYLKDAEETEEAEEKRKKKVSVQMRYNVEAISTGARLYQMIQLEDVTLVELGCLVSAIVTMAESPYLGGKKSIGMGRYMLDYKYEGKDFISVDKDSTISCSPFAEEALEAYNKQIQSIKVTDADIWSK